MFGVSGRQHKNVDRGQKQEAAWPASERNREELDLLYLSFKKTVEKLGWILFLLKDLCVSGCEEVCCIRHAGGKCGSNTEVQSKKKEGANISFMG